MQCIVAGLVALMWLSVAMPARGSVALALELSDLVRESDTIVVAKVLHRHSYWEEQRIVTDVRLTVQEAWFGPWREGDELIVRALGGRLDDVGLKVAGEPRFWEEERLVLFGRSWGSQPWLRATGASQGVMPLFDRAGAVVALPGGEGQQLVRVIDGKLQPATPAIRSATELDALRERVRALVAEVK